MFVFVFRGECDWNTASFSTKTLTGIPFHTKYQVCCFLRDTQAYKLKTNKQTNGNKQKAGRGCVGKYMYMCGLWQAPLLCLLSLSFVYFSFLPATEEFQASDWHRDSKENMKIPRRGQVLYTQTRHSFIIYRSPLSKRGTEVSSRSNGAIRRIRWPFQPHTFALPAGKTNMPWEWQEFLPSHSSGTQTERHGKTVLDLPSSAKPTSSCQHWQSLSFLSKT